MINCNGRYLCPEENRNSDNSRKQFNLKRTLITTGYSIKFEYWDDKKKSVKRAYPDHDDIEITVNKIYLRLNNILDYANENDIESTVDFVLKKLVVEREYKYKQKQARTNLFAILDQWAKKLNLIRI